MKIIFDEQQKTELKKRKLWKIVKQHTKNCPTKSFTSQPLKLRSAFSWADTPEGYKYWLGVNNALDI